MCTILLEDSLYQTLNNLRARVIFSDSIKNQLPPFVYEHAATELHFAIGYGNKIFFNVAPDENYTPTMHSSRGRMSADIYLWVKYGGGYT